MNTSNTVSDARLKRSQIQTQGCLRKNLIKQISGPKQQRQASHGSQKLGLTTNPTSPSSISKRYVGGFGGAGSIYTHSHITQTRKQSHYIMTLGGNSGQQSNARCPMQITADSKVRLNSQDALPSNRNTSSIDSQDLMVAGNRASISNYFQELQMQAPTQVVLSNVLQKD